METARTPAIQTASNIPMDEGNIITLKTLQNHLIKTIFGALIFGVLSAGTTAYAFYHKTNETIEELKANKIQVNQDISNIKNDIGDIKISLSNNGIYTDTNKDEIKEMKAKIDKMQETQTDMFKLLVEIKARQGK